MSQIDEIRQLIQEDEIDRALALSMEVSQNFSPKYRNEITLQYSSWRSLKESDRKGMLSRDDILRESRRIKHALLDLLSELEERNLSRHGSPEPPAVTPPQAGEHKLRVFLCHASQDKPTVRDLYQRLSAEPWIDPWLDEERLLPGQDWNLEIEKAVESSDAVIVCVSKTSVSKEGYVQKELRRILDIALEKLEGAIFILPVKLEDCELPRQLRDWQALNYFPASNRTTAYERLKTSLKIRKDHLGI